jgi:hypothetical protein
VIDLVDAYWGESDWGRDRVSEDGGCRVAEVRVNELIGDYTVAVEGLSVGEVGG